MTKGNRMKLITRTVVAGALTLGLVGGLASTASAAGDPTPVPGSPGEGGRLYHADRTLAENQAKCTKAVDKRVRDLAKWSAQVNQRYSRGQITLAQRDAIVAIITDSSTALTTVAKPAIAAADAGTIAAACSDVINVYRVYKVVHPKVFLLAAANAWSNRIGALQTASGLLTGKTVDTKFVERLNALNARITRASSLVDPVSTNAAALTAAGYNASPKTVERQIKSMRRDLERARGVIKSAERQARSLNRWKPKAPKPTVTSTTVGAPN